MRPTRPVLTFQIITVQKILIVCIRILLCFGPLAAGAQQKTVVFCGTAENDLYSVLVSSGFTVKLVKDAAAAVEAAETGGAILMMAEAYPARQVQVNAATLKQIQEKKIRLYIEYPAEFPGLEIGASPLRSNLERAVIAAPGLGEKLPPMTILGINDCYVMPVQQANPLVVMAKVAGFSKAAYGINDVKTWPLLVKSGNDVMVATTKLSNFATGRYGPHAAWQALWEYVVGWATRQPRVQLSRWPSTVSAAYGPHEKLPSGARQASIRRGVEWFSKGRFFIHESWQDMYLRYQGNGQKPFGPGPAQSLPVGNGSLGMLEGHASHIYHDGSQEYRYWVRADVQGEAAYALAAAGQFLKNETVLFQQATRLIDFIFSGSNLRGGPRNNPDSASFGLIGWAVTHPHIYYGDDNARVILGVLGAAASMRSNRWNREITEAILGNFYTTGKNGFRGGHINDSVLQSKGRSFFAQRDLVNPAPHYESWLWACYLWMYRQTGYRPLLEKAKTAIHITMKGYPHEWRWTNGIQQERARMILPLAWLVRVEDTPQHREWLHLVVTQLLKNQVESGAIQEELGGAGKGRYGRTASNAAYGQHEAPVIFDNGDPVADMLYTCNFAVFSLNEAAHATGNAAYKKAVDKLSDFLVRIQAVSNRHKDMDGAWFRAFDFDRWEYWGSNADVGWGVWGTLGGWTQSWIVATLVLTSNNQSYWEITKDLNMKKHMDNVLLQFNHQ